MAVTDKQADIAILRTLAHGHGPSWPCLLFKGRWSALLAGAGIVGGVLLALNIDGCPVYRTHPWRSFPLKEVYYISDLPSDLHM